MLLAMLVLSSGCGSNEEVASNDPTSESPSTTVSAATTTSAQGSPLDCAAPGPEYVDGDQATGVLKEGVQTDRTPEEALEQYVEIDERSLPDSGYVPVLQSEGQHWVDFVHRAEDGRRTVQVRVVRSESGGWRASGHARCR
ncbi:MAG: hypothetical protein CYG61_00435 [Actinobacteria bacterium]|nr:MAG: hypothetical protein CYG61_00435 [Actinomycetota bacterium]